jgi:hypothetical protein
MEVQIKRSKRKDKKFDAIIDGKKTVSFGAAGMSDYTKHQDAERKERYINRHKKKEDWSNPKTAGFYAKNVLWNKTSLQASVADINKKFPKLNVKLKL